MFVFTTDPKRATEVAHTQHRRDIMINWTAAPAGTTHATIPNGDPIWYKLANGKVFCWGTRIKEWVPSFFLSTEEIADTGLRLYACGEQSELVMLREQRDLLICALSDVLSLFGRDEVDDEDAHAIIREATEALRIAEEAQ